MKILKFLLVLGLMTVAFQAPAQSVYVTKTGEKYHKSSCHFLKNSKKEITLDKAVQLGFSACSVCKPTTSKSTTTNITSVNSLYKETTGTAQKGTTTQCTGKTKSGTRCKRMTKDANGRCYQH